MLILKIFVKFELIIVKFVLTIVNFVIIVKLLSIVLKFFLYIMKFSPTGMKSCIKESIYINVTVRREFTQLSDAALANVLQNNECRFFFNHFLVCFMNKFIKVNL